MSSTSNSGLRPRLVSMGRTVIRIPTREESKWKHFARRFNEYHGVLPRSPSVCTCAEDHGWHA